MASTYELTENICKMIYRKEFTSKSDVLFVLHDDHLYNVICDRKNPTQVYYALKIKIHRPEKETILNLFSDFIESNDDYDLTLYLRKLEYDLTTENAHLTLEDAIKGNTPQKRCTVLKGAGIR